MDNQRHLKFLIFNENKNSKLGIATCANTFFSRFKGLMLKKEIKEGIIIKIPTGRNRFTSAIHTFFMLAPIDVIFLNDKKIVIDAETLEPWSFYVPTSRAKYVIELKKGMIKKSKTEIGDKISMRKM
ncbi:protein of unknown function DUF192 [Methanothermus fervidus DSM 2088]|uniref:Uncharacterized protein n=1 Tax=Methanothermus fervidus (strain ATCC 43054 / DSM 2088 / JCM 10308 / V24 S) TaxID=523846 RepID=E3GZ71_METFV|nr:DUF192 domain-containing protein [Methanothermus fervidus]ADP77603.1 protein of unknown function DUF192 [Methanothermus fervidus DSM 2088]